MLYLQEEALLIGHVGRRYSTQSVGTHGPFGQSTESKGEAKGESDRAVASKPLEKATRGCEQL
jgi:hypothetical protein